MAGKPRAGVAVSEMVTARLTPGERAALDALLQARAAEMEERGEPGDASFAGWLRWTIRQQAKAAGIVVESPHAPAPEPPKAKRPRAKK